MMPVIEIDKIYQKKEQQEEYEQERQRIGRGNVEDLKFFVLDWDLDAIQKHLLSPSKPNIPEWIRKWADEMAGEAYSLEEFRRMSKNFKTPLSEEVIAEREEQR